MTHSDKNGYGWHTGDKCHFLGTVIDHSPPGSPSGTTISFAGTARRMILPTASLQRPPGWTPPRMREPVAPGAIVCDAPGVHWVLVGALGRNYWRKLGPVKGDIERIWTEWSDIVDPKLVFAGIE